jgi:hypothetical protein
MSGLQIFVQRKRRVLIRYGAVVVLGVAGLIAILPRADAHGTDAQIIAPADRLSALLSPAPLSGRQFAAFYGVPHS